MGPKFYIEDVNEWDTKYSIDYIKFDEFGVIDVVRVTEEKRLSSSREYSSYQSLIRKMSI